MRGIDSGLSAFWVEPMASTRAWSDSRFSALERQLHEGRDPAAERGVGLGEDERLLGIGAGGFTGRAIPSGR
jgi:hypothetical protein